MPTTNYRTRAPPAGLPFHSTLLPIQINPPILILAMLLKAPTPADKQTTNILPLTMSSSIQGCGGRENRGGRRSYGERDGRANRNKRDGRSERGGRKVQEENASANNLFENNDHNFIGEVNAKDPKAKRPKRGPQNQNMTPQEKLVLI